MTTDEKNIQIVRLMSGEELICDLTVEGDNYTLETPCIVLPTGQNNIGLAPWIPYADYGGKVTLGDKVVAFVVAPHEDLAKEYKRVTTGGPELVVPNKEVVGAIGGPVGTAP